MCGYIFSFILFFVASVFYSAVVVIYGSFSHSCPITFVVLGLLTLVYLISVYFCVTLYLDSRERKIMDCRRKSETASEKTS